MTGQAEETPDLSMSSRVALVTGGTRGIGLGIARALAEDGWNLAIGGTRPDADVSAVVGELRALGAAVQYLRGDLARSDDRARFVAEARARFGAVNALVNNAGRAPRVRADLLEATEESFDEVLRTNLQGPYFLTQHVARLLVTQRREQTDAPAAIVFVPSVSAVLASTTRGGYCVSSAGQS